MNEDDRQHALRAVKGLEKILERIEVELLTDPDGERLHDYMDTVDLHYTNLNEAVARAYRQTMEERAEL